MYDKFVENVRLRRWTVFLVIALLLYLMRSQMTTILLTFIFSFLAVRSLQHLRRHFPIKRPWMVVGPLYLLVIGLLYLVLTHYVPIIARESHHVINGLIRFYNSPEFDQNATWSFLSRWIDRLGLANQLHNGLNGVVATITSIGHVGFAIVISFILSFFFAVEIDDLKRFGHNFLTSDLGWFFQDFNFFAQKFVNTFGVVMEAQLFIAVVNTTITAITLFIMRMPNLASLTAMVFFFSLVPVAGVIISLIPLSLVAFSVGGWQDVIYILIMIAVIHVLEAYILNPKFMASRTQLPVFFTFVVLIFAPEIMGPWGLIVGIPVFTFLLDILGVKSIPRPQHVKRVKKIVKEAVHDDDSDHSSDKK
ncbi:AI-2E family transporter [Schleiferilactobacillus harbinensis]|uniref:AI-2E family transporter n=1 Tax=Schleiferilactobacillus harbinensis TaxID=304207 RepID=UPI0021A54931|nr:AI-2E family transporter [Schleiferilactobacillus harbinensis]MCT2909377.1 AI-2E family transporter [Schleiferilactobacillus harbinensis]